MLQIVWGLLAAVFVLWLFITVILWLWKRSEARQAEARHARLKRMAQSYDPELMPWKSRIRPATKTYYEDEDDGA